MRLFFLALAFLALAGCQPQAEAKVLVAVGGSSTALARFQTPLGAYRQSHSGVELTVQTWNSATALKKLGDRALDVALISQPLSDTTDLVPLPLAQEPIAVIVHPANKVGNLALEQLQRLFSGRTQDWSQVGGGPGAIQAASREEGSGTRKVFLALVLDKRSLARTARIFPSPADVIGFVAENRNAIGYASLSNLGSAEKVKMIKIDGLDPSSTGYRLTQPLLAVTRADSSPVATEIASFLASSTGPTATIQSNLQPKP